MAQIALFVGELERFFNFFGHLSTEELIVQTVAGGRDAPLG